MLPGQAYQMWQELDPRIEMEDNDPEPDPYTMLVLKIVERALLDLEDNTHTDCYEQRDAYWWLFLDTRDANTPFTLAWCCEYLGLTMRQVRAAAERRYPCKCGRLGASLWAKNHRRGLYALLAVGEGNRRTS